MQVWKGGRASAELINPVPANEGVFKSQRLITKKNRLTVKS
jgi:hypothetical protein